MFVLDAQDVRNFLLTNKFYKNTQTQYDIYSLVHTPIICTNAMRWKIHIHKKKTQNTCNDGKENRTTHTIRTPKWLALLL